MLRLKVQIELAWRAVTLFPNNDPFSRERSPRRAPNLKAEVDFKNGFEDRL